MNLEFDEDESALLEQVAAVFRDIAPVAGGSAGPPGEVWPALVQAGWSALGRDLESGELSVGLAAGVFRAAGHQLLLDSYLNGCYILPALSAHCARPADADRLAQRLARRPGVFLGDGRDAAIPVVAPDARTGYAFGATADVDVYRLAEGPDGRLVLGLWTGSAPSVQYVPALSRSVARVAVPAPEDAWIDHPLDIGFSTLARLERTAVLLHSAGLVGCAEELLDITCTYVRGRVQFGAPIGSYQAVKHALADVFTADLVAWNAVLVAAAEGADEVSSPLVARFLAVECALGAARAGAQFHGGMGFTAELPVHLFLKAVLDGAQRAGGHEEFAARLGDEFVRRAC